MYQKVLMYCTWKLAKKQIDPLSANFTKWSNTLKQFVANLPMNCLSVFDHFVGLAVNSFMTEVIIICRAIQWTGFYMITTSIMKELTG